MVESGLFTFFSRLAQTYVWTKTKAFYQSCTLRFLHAGVDQIWDDLRLKLLYGDLDLQLASL